MVKRVSLSLRLLVLASTLAVAACGTSGGRGGALASLGGGSSATQQPNLLAAMGNGLLGSSIKMLNETDRRKALEAEYRALEYSPAGKAVSWEGSSSTSGEVTAAQPYQVGSQNCRQYTHSFTIGNEPRTARGTACRNPDGSWSPLT